MLRRILLACLPVLFVTVLTPSGARAAWPHDPYSGAVAVSTGAGSQEVAEAVSDGAGGAIFVWVDDRSGNDDIYAQRVSAAGVPLWTANGVAVCSAVNGQTGPRVVADGFGGVFVAWTDARGASLDVYAQRLNSAGVAQWTANGLAVCTAAGSQIVSDLQRDSGTGILLTWNDARGLSTDIYAQRVSLLGNPYWTANGVGVCTLTSLQTAPVIASDGTGGAIVTWMDQRSGTFNNYAQRLNSGGAAQWTANGIAICTAAGVQHEPSLLPDGTGGAFVVWYDSRDPSGYYDVYAQHLSAAGVLLWSANGLTIAATTSDQYVPVITEDGAGGFFVAWSDFRSVDIDVYAQHVSGAGTALWTANGIPIATANGTQYSSRIVSDGLGGMIVAWQDSRNYSVDVYAQRVSATGVAQWTSGGLLVSGAPDYQGLPQLAPDGAGGAIVAWWDYRSFTSMDLYCQRVERYGQLGNPEPVITSVGDVKNDQGGFVKVVWSASYLDADPTYGITEYRVFRSVPGAALASAFAAGRATTTDSDEAVREGKLLVTPTGATTTSWEYVGSQTAEAFATYSKVVATTADSVGGSNPRTYFLVEARASTSISSDRWSSAPDSGYSVDNLAPAAPAPLTGQYSLGTTQLHWNRNTEADLAGYKLYRGSSVSFVPGPANFVAQLPDTGAADAAGAPYVYKLTAVDVHGNESPVATLIPSGTLGVGDGPARAALSFAAPSPNPARGSATLRYSLSSRGAVKLALFDAAGRRVATVADGVMEAGEHSVAFALRDDAGRELPAGLYLARLEAEGRVLTRRIAAVR